ncbi:hypothetical protein ABEB36_010523 [Hypothenemus hampei]|uniref:Chitin-binding type-2 domain-containing protein n=1 Tax=Hypothenemus hampei TaxID=57062 RepID=A0ABD1EM59_HYPHA
MQGVSVLLFLGILAKWSCNAVFLNHRPFPTYSLENMPETAFSCREKILGGYYADPDTQCQMFHVCVKVAGIGVQDFRFLCPNGTAFDQDHQICADWEDVDCDATTLYYSSDNFDLYRVGSGFESKLHKYGEDEETFALQRAETGDARINREPQTQVVNQRKEYQRPPQTKRTFANNNNNNNNNNNQEKEIFKTSSSSNFFNNRNNGKETDDDEYDDNINVNQNRDYEQKRKIVRKQQKRPSDEENYPQTKRPQRPTGFVNNFAGSSYGPTSQRTPSSTVNNNFRVRSQKQKTTAFTNAQNNSPAVPTYTISTPAPFRQSSVSNLKLNTQNNEQYSRGTTENYPQPRPSSINYDVPKVTKQQTENYPSNNPQYSKSTTPFDKKSNSPKKIDNVKPTTFSPHAKPFSFPNNQASTVNTFPTTFAPRTQQAYTNLAQYTTNNLNNPQNPTTFQSSTTQYTPTVPKITQTTPVTRSNRFDETQYDDGSYDPKYDYSNSEDEFLKTAHSQNIASSRNELAKVQKTVTSTQKPYETPRTYTAPKKFETYQKTTQVQTSQATQKPVSQNKTKPITTKKIKDVSYDYAYYDSLGPEPDYQIDTEIKKETFKN